MDNTILHITLKKAAPPGMETAAAAIGVPEPSLIFKGPQTTPFLAPRGVFLHPEALLVSDTGRNRVFIWRHWPTQMHEEPDVVLGQENSTGTGRNAGGEVNGSTLQYPSGVWTDGRRLIVADAWNHRVLIWHDMPQRHGQAADVVLGQADMCGNQPNAQKVGAAPGPNTLYWPYGVFSDGQHLWIADTGNRRILFFENIPETNFAAADRLIGKPDFYTRDYDNQDPIWPYSVKIGPEGQMIVADTQYYRMLVWPDWRLAFTQKAPLVIGQPDLESNGQNQYQLHPMAHTLNWCYDACFHGPELLLADTGNSRILRYPALPPLNNWPAEGLIGKPDFYTGSENADTVFGTEKSLYWPFSIGAHADTLAVADTGNHRILFYPL
jgi:hypothetical protein